MLSDVHQVGEAAAGDPIDSEEVVTQRLADGRYTDGDARVEKRVDTYQFRRPRLRAQLGPSTCLSEPS